MFKSLALGALSLSLFAFSGNAQAAILGFSASIDGSPAPGLAVYSGGNGSLFGGSLDVFSDGTYATFSGNAGVVSGSQSGNYAAPWLNGGQESTPYFQAGTGGSITFSFAQPTSQVGLLWGSVDTDPGRNQIDVYSTDGLLLGSFDGSAVQSAVPGLNVGSWGEDGTVYANITAPTAEIGQVVFSDSSSNAFEFDNVSAVPLPGALPLFGSALFAMMGLAGARRRHRRPVAA